MALNSKKKVTTKPKPNQVKKLGVAGKFRSSVEKEHNFYQDLQKSGFIKITKPGYLDEAKSKYIAPKYTVTPKGSRQLKYGKDTTNAYAKDPMKLRPKETTTTRRKLGA